MELSDEDDTPVVTSYFKPKGSTLDMVYKMVNTDIEVKDKIQY